MVALVKIVGETEVDNGVVAPQQTQPIRITAPVVSEPDPRVDTLIDQVAKIAQEAQGRLLALEQAVQGVPRAVGIARTLLAALSARMLAFIALIGCLALAGAEVFNPSWQILSTLAILIVGIFGPLIACSYWKNS